MNLKGKSMIIMAVIAFFCATLFFFVTKPSFALTDALLNEKELGVMCINQAVPMARLAAETDGYAPDTADDDKKENDSETDSDAGEDGEVSENVMISGDPLVIIYHTHSSESYMPYTESNYHRIEEEGTVRDVGSVLEEELKKKGINVIHDKTIHDRPSYNESYERSLETAEALIKKYPTAVYVIDLHRDAAAASATEGKYLEIDGERVAKFSLVVGQANDNYKQLYDFAKTVSGKAESKYAGFGGSIIQKNYNYNEFISDKALLLEVGNNKNTIEEARACGKYFAEVLADVIRENQ